MVVPRYFTIGEIVAQLRLSRKFVRAEITAGRLDAVKINDRGDLRIPESSLNAWLAHRSPAA